MRPSSINRPEQHRLALASRVVLLASLAYAGASLAFDVVVWLGA